MCIIYTNSRSTHVQSTCNFKEFIGYTIPKTGQRVCVQNAAVNQMDSVMYVNKHPLIDCTHYQSEWWVNILPTHWQYLEKVPRASFQKKIFLMIFFTVKSYSAFNFYDLTGTGVLAPVVLVLLCEISSRMSPSDTLLCKSSIYNANVNKSLTV